MDHNRLLQMAKDARANAYAPYSGFSVGAALLTHDGRVFLGCNVENASFTPTCCAERVAIFQAISKGARSFDAIAIVGGYGNETAPLCSPCGVCRQVLAEFCDDTLPILLEDEQGAPVRLTLGDLLPARFRLSHLTPSEEV